MPNCDFNSPCDCRDCRTISELIKCPKCGFSNVVLIEQISLGKTRDRKGIIYYEFEKPKEPIKDLNCYKCNFLLEKVGYYSEIAVEANKYQIRREELISQNRLCSICNKIETLDFVPLFGKVVLERKNGKNLCQECYANEMEKEILNPSNEFEKYSFDKRQLKWILIKVKLACQKCGKFRWLNVENRWKKLCWNCYKELNS